MNRKALLLAGLLTLLGIGYQQRERLLLAGVNALLADETATITALSGLRIGTGSARLERVELLFPAAGLNLAIDDITLGYRQGEGLLPVPETLVFGTVELVQVDASGPSGAAAGGTGNAVPDVLTLLRNFPLQRIEAASVQLPFWPEPFALTLQAEPGAIALTLRGERYAVDAAFTQPDAASPARLSLELREDGGSGGVLSVGLLPEEDSIVFQGSATLAAYAAQTTNIAGLSFAANGSIVATDAGVQLRLEPGFVLALQSLRSAGLQLDDFTLTGSAPLLLRQSAASGVQVEAAALDGSFGALVTGDWSAASAFSLRNLQLAWMDTLTMTLAAATNDLALAGPYDWLPAFDVDATLDLANERLRFDTPLRLRAVPDSGVRVQGELDLAAGGGTAQLVVPQLDLSGEGNSLAARLGGWPWAADLIGGTLAAEADLAWQSGAGGMVTGNMKAAFAEVAGFYGSSFFRGLDLVFDAAVDTGDPLPLATPPLELKLAELDVGLPLRNLSASLQADAASQSLVLGSLYGELLDGTLSASDQRYRIGAVDNALTLQFSDFRLERLLELAEYDGVQASGAVSGEVPLVFSANGIEVAGGRLFAEQPGGSIRYLGAVGGGQGNAALDLMNSALGNYLFDSLESSIDYSPDGELLLSMQLQGHNPDMDGGRRINLNLNLSDNIPALLRSLQAGRAIEDFVQEQYR